MVLYNSWEACYCAQQYSISISSWIFVKNFIWNVSITLWQCRMAYCEECCPRYKWYWIIQNGTIKGSGYIVHSKYLTQDVLTLNASVIQCNTIDQLNNTEWYNQGLRVHCTSPVVHADLNTALCRWAYTRPEANKSDISVCSEQRVTELSGLH